MYVCITGNIELMKELYLKNIEQDKIGWSEDLWNQSGGWGRSMVPRWLLSLKLERETGGVTKDESSDS